jgi:hypothetical protein
MSAEHAPHVVEQTSHRFSLGRRREAAAPPSSTPVVTHIGDTAVDPHLVAEPVDGLAALESGVLKFAARLTDPDGAPLGGATVLFTISVAARTPVKCAAVTDDNGRAHAESTLPLGLFDHGALEFRVGFAGAPPLYWPVSVAGKIV